MEPVLSTAEVRPTPGPKPHILISNVSLKLLAVALILVFLYFAASVLITLLLAILIAYFLDPIVEFLERMRMPRTLASMITVLLLIGVLGAVGYGLFSRGSDFAANWPKYSGTLKNAVNSVETKLNGIERQVSDGEISPQPSQRKGPSKTVAGAENALRAAVMHIIGSLSGLVLEVTFVPFLVFFMLSEKQDISKGNAGRFARRAARLPGGYVADDADRDSCEQRVLLGHGPGLPDIDRHSFGIVEYGSLFWSGTVVVAAISDGACETTLRGFLRVDRGCVDGDSYAGE